MGSEIQKIINSVVGALVILGAGIVGSVLLGIVYENLWVPIILTPFILSVVVVVGLAVSESDN